MDSKQKMGRWNEKGGTNSLHQDGGVEVTDSDIVQMHQILAEHHEVKMSEIKWEFRPIEDQTDKNRFDNVYLYYYMPVLKNGVMTKRQIFELKVKVPDRVKMRAQEVQGGANPAATTTARNRSVPAALRAQLAQQNAQKSTANAKPAN